MKIMIHFYWLFCTTSAQGKPKKKRNTPLTSFLLITIFPQSNNTVVKWTLKNPPQRWKCNMIFCALSNWASCSSAGMNHCECVCPKQQNKRGLSVKHWLLCNVIQRETLLICFSTHRGFTILVPKTHTQTHQTHWRRNKFWVNPVEKRELVQQPIIWRIMEHWASNMI